jgi:phosphatidylglycerol:prolipoprotein diacylglycerol transferase
MRPILFHLGDIAIPSFWAMSFLGFLAALLVVRRDMLERGMPERQAYDMILWGYVGGWVGARLFVIPTGWQYFVEAPVAFLLSGSGWVWYGGVIGGAAAILIWATRVGIPARVIADIAAPGLAIGLAIGRIGCQLAGDGDYGVPTDLPWGMSYPDGVVPTTDRVHPTPIYELIGYVAIFLVLWRQRHRLPPGHLIAQYLIYSGIVRFLVEFLRRNPDWLIGLTTAQWMSLGSIAIGVWLLRPTPTAQARP